MPCVSSGSSSSSSHWVTRALDTHGTYDACSEEAHLRLMQCYLSQGQVQLAIRQFHTCVQALKNELDVPPSAEIRNMYDRIMAARR